MSSSAAFISQTYFLPLSASPFHSTITRLCRNNFCGSGWAIQSNRGTRSGSCQSLVSDPMPRLCGEHTVQIREQAWQMGKQFWQFFFLHVFCVCHPHATWIPVQSTPPRITRVSQCCPFRLSWWWFWERPAQRGPPGSIWEQVSLAWYDVLFQEVGESGLGAICRWKQIKNTFILLLLLSSSSKSKWGNFKMKEPDRLAEGNTDFLWDRFPKPGRTFLIFMLRNKEKGYYISKTGWVHPTGQTQLGLEVALLWGSGSRHSGMAYGQRQGQEGGRADGHRKES